ncbi:MAG: hypothetical protein DCE90_01085 [Pseudanabaena sp.]|nr:MAG: hypothetical protein DCE90_01085 [Pseudanabaena sp.]
MNAFCTIVTPSHLHLAKALAESLEASGNSETLFILLISENNPQEDIYKNVKICQIEQLAKELPQNICWYFDNFELCNALKPFIVKWVFQQGFEKVIFLDADIYVVGSFAPVWQTLDAYSLLLTPHHICPPPLKLTYANESVVADLGIFNGGFAGWRSSEKALEMLDWMCTRFPIYGFCDQKNGMFVDQKLIPLLLQYYANYIGISSNPCLNIAFWNAHERNVSYLEKVYLINDNPVIFFHMSGFRLAKPELPCSYLPSKQNKDILNNAPWMSLLLEDYGNLIKKFIEQDSKDQRLRVFTDFNGFKLTRSMRYMLFRKGQLSRKDPEVWKLIVREFITEKLKYVKRYLFPYREK